MLLTVRYTASLPAGFASGTLQLKTRTVYVDAAGRVNEPFKIYTINADRTLTSLQGEASPVIVGMGQGDPATASPLEVVVEIVVTGLPLPQRSSFEVAALDTGGAQLDLHHPNISVPQVGPLPVLLQLLTDRTSAAADGAIAAANTANTAAVRANTAAAAALAAAAASGSGGGNVGGTGTLLGQGNGVIDDTSRALTAVPSGTGYARLQIVGCTMSARYDAAPATRAALEERYAPGGTLELLSAQEVSNFRFINATAGSSGSFSVLYTSS